MHVTVCRGISSHFHDTPSLAVTCATMYDVLHAGLFVLLSLSVALAMDWLRLVHACLRTWPAWSHAVEHWQEVSRQERRPLGFAVEAINLVQHHVHRVLPSKNTSLSPSTCSIAPATSFMPLLSVMPDNHVETCQLDVSSCQASCQSRNAYHNTHECKVVLITATQVHLPLVYTAKDEIRHQDVLFTWGQTLQHPHPHRIVSCRKRNPPSCHPSRLNGRISITNSIHTQSYRH